MDSSTHAPTPPPAALDDSAADVLTDAAEAASTDPLDGILRQIVGGYFVLTDGQGSVSKWSEPAELLFGRGSEDILGRSFFETLIQHPLPPGAQSWRAFLESGEAPSSSGRVDITGMHADGHAFPTEAVFVPVKLDEGFDFSLFLEDLSFELPMNLMLLRMRQQHPVVVRALRQALEPVAQPWEGWRTAGTLVIFTPRAATPWVQEALTRREAARAESDAEVEERLANPDQGPQGSVGDLDDAAAVVARLLTALERIDDLERVAHGLPSQLEEARKTAEARAAAAEARIELLLAEAKRGGGGAPDPELLARLERLERSKLDTEQAGHDARKELQARLERLEREHVEALSAADARLAAAVAEAQRRAEEAVGERRSGDSDVREAQLAAQLERVRAEQEEAVQAARRELEATLERLQREREHEAEAARAELAAALERVERVQRDADALREQFSEVAVGRAEAAGLAGDDRRRLDELAREQEAAEQRIEALRAEQEATLAELRAEQERLAAEATRGTDAVDAGELAAAQERVEAMLAEAATELRAEHAAAEKRFEEVVSEQAAAREQIDALRRQHEEVRANLQQAERERDEFRSASERASQQLAEVRETLAEQESSTRIPAELVVERHELENLKAAEKALRARVDELDAAGRAASQRLEELTTARDAAAKRLEQVAATEARLEETLATSEVLAERVEQVDRDGIQRAKELAAATTGMREQIAEVSERVTAIDRGAGSVLTDVQALRERLDEVAGAGGGADLDELKGAVARLGGELEVARGQVARAEEEALGAREQAATAQGTATAAREDAARARDEAATMRRELQAGADKVELVDAQLEKAREVAAAAADAAKAATTKLSELDARAQGLRAELTAGRERLDALGAAVEQLGSDDGKAEELRSEIAAVRGLAEETKAEVEALRADLGDAATAGEKVKAGEQRIEAMQAEVTFALKTLEEMKASLTSAGQAAVIARREAEQAKKAAATLESNSGVHEVFQQLLAAAGGGAPARRASRDSQVLRRKSEVPKREARHGFDDVQQPIALLDLEGRFRELNPSFARLVGYQEHEFVKATWPSPHDRPVYQQQQEQLRQLASGEIESVSLQSTYMHGQGLMVPVVGTLKVVPGEDGLPLHLLLEAEDRHHH